MGRILCGNQMYEALKEDEKKTISLIEAFDKALEQMEALAEDLGVASIELSAWPESGMRVLNISTWDEDRHWDESIDVLRYEDGSHNTRIYKRKGASDNEHQ